MPQRLKVPDALAGLGVERDRAVREKIIAVPVAAVEVKGGRPQPGEHHARDSTSTLKPPQALTAPRPFHESPFHVSCAEFPRPGHGPEPPDFLARANVERSDVSRRGDPGPFPARNADDDRIVPDGGGRGRPVVERSDFRVEPVTKIADSPCAEFRVELAGLRVERKQRVRPTYHE